MRARLGCARVDLPPVEWHVDAKKLRAGGWMGRHPLPGRTELQAGIKVNPRYPWEPPEEGCPASWYRSRFTGSLQLFLRTRAENGVRNSNPILDRYDDELVVQLVLYLEHEQERWEGWREEQAARGDEP